jgi:hypothetical protein
MKPPITKVIVITLIAFGFSTVGFINFLDEYFYRTRLRVADPKAGRIYAEDVKSSSGVARVYLTRTEKIPFDYFWYFSSLLSVAVIVTAYFLLLKKRRRAISPFAT